MANENGSREPRQAGIRQSRKEREQAADLSKRVVVIRCPQCERQRSTVRLSALIEQLGLPEDADISEIKDLCAKCAPLSADTRALRAARSREYQERRKAAMTEEQLEAERQRRREYQQKRNARIKEALAALEATQQAQPAESDADTGGNAEDQEAQGEGAEAEA